jgi:hypothetical protein
MGFIRRLWQRTWPWLVKLSHAEAFVSALNFLRAVFTNPLLQGLIAAGVVLVWTVLTSDYGPYVFVLMLGVFTLTVIASKALSVKTILGETVAEALRRPAEIEYVEVYPHWIEQAVEDDRRRFREALKPISEPRVSLHLDDRTRPYVNFRFDYVNSSVFTLILSDITRGVEVGGTQLSGRFDFNRTAVSHGGVLHLNLQFVLDTDASVNYLKELVGQEKAINFKLGASIRTTTREDDSLEASLTFGEIFWRR